MARAATACAALFALAACAAADAPPPLEVHLVPHSHDDAGWLKTVDEYFWGARQDVQVAGVQYILDAVVAALEADPDRRFAYAEVAFLERWWRQQDATMKTKVRRLVAQGRLAIVGGGYVQHDEAAAHYAAQVDQLSRGVSSAASLGRPVEVENILETNQPTTQPTDQPTNHSLITDHNPK